MHMERPQLYFFLLPFSVLTIALYFKVLFVLWKRRESKGNLFYKLIRAQAIFDISYVVWFFVSEIPQDWLVFHDYLLGLNGTFEVQFTYAHRYACVYGQILGVTLISISRMMIFRFPHASKVIENLSTVKVTLSHMTAPILFGLYIFFGQTHSHFEFVPAIDRMARVTNLSHVQINSLITMISSFSGAFISTICYILIFLTLKKSTFRMRKKERSLMITSFVLFLCLCALAVFYLANGLFSFIDLNAMYILRLHYYSVSFPISLLNPWCLLLTSGALRQEVLGKRLILAIARCLPSRTPPTQVTSQSPKY